MKKNAGSGSEPHKWSYHLRQDSELWSHLHAGVLTSSVLLDALGLRERAAGKRLGLPKHEVRIRVSACVSRRQSGLWSIPFAPEVRV